MSTASIFCINDVVATRTQYIYAHFPFIECRLVEVYRLNANTANTAHTQHTQHTQWMAENFE